jgi:uncharacterized protein YndB with AHSA1/START domain
MATPMAMDKLSGAQPPPLVVTRLFSASPKLVFSAWSSAEHVRQWFCPAGYTIPEAEVDFRVGGAFNICMRSGEGLQHWTRGKFLEIQPHSRLVIEMLPGGDDRTPLFLAHTTVSFAEEAHGTRLHIEQRYTLYAAEAESMVKGAPQGWGQTLDRLGQLLEKLKLAPAGVYSAVPSTFTIERTYEATRAQVYRALTDPEAKAQWFGAGGAFKPLERMMEVRNGGRELFKARWDSGMVTTFEAHYHDVVPEERLVYAYSMYLDERKISVSLATFELKPAGSGTRLVLTEQGVFLDGYDDAGSREHGSGWLLDALGSSLKANAS